jgi:hypothetical protein
MDLPAVHVSPKPAGDKTLHITFGLIFEEAVDLGYGSVEGNDSEAVVGSVQDQILAHDRKANETEITTGVGLRRADLEASQSRSMVSILFVNRCNHQGNVRYSDGAWGKWL